jgi:hypothetical protein
MLLYRTMMRVFWLGTMCGSICTRRGQISNRAATTKQIVRGISLREQEAEEKRINNDGNEGNLG